MVEVQGQGSFPLGASERMLGSNAEAEKSVVQGCSCCSPKEPQPKCPECESSRLYRDGMRYLSNGEAVQRWLCRDCGYRFSEKRAARSGQPLKKSLKWHLKTKSTIAYDRQVCVLARGAKNLELTKTRQEQAQREGTEQSTDQKGKIIEHAWWMKKQGYKEGTIISRTKLLSVMVKRGADLLNPESIKEVIAKQTWSEGRKENAVNAYTTFLRMTGGNWNPPIYGRIRKLPFIPSEQEIDTLIASCAAKAATLLQTLKETGARVGEAWMLKWTDLDIEKRTIRITPEKGSDPRIFKITPKLLSMLLSMPKKGCWIFGNYPLNGYRTCFTRQRRKAASKLGNPRLLQITFHTFRHWKATMEYHRTKDILYVMRLLGHKSIKNTLVYTQLIEFKEDEFVCKVAKTVREASELIENGFDFVCEFEDAKLFRKRK